MASPPPYGVPSHVEGGDISMTFAAITSAFLRVYRNSAGRAAIAGNTQKSIGVNWMNNVEAADDVGTVRLKRKFGQIVMVASAAISVAAPVYAAASGKVGPFNSASGVEVGGILEGYAVTSAAADGDLIVVEPAGFDEPDYGIVHLVTSGEAAANSNNGRIDFDTGFGAKPRRYTVDVEDASTQVANVGYVTSKLLTTDLGKVRVDGIGSGLQLDEGDIVVFRAWK